MIQPTQTQSEGVGVQADTSSLANVLQEPHNHRLRSLLYLLLTFTAGWTDAICYLALGHVFSSFMTGNFLFVGLGAVQGNSGLLIRAVVALLIFLAGVTLGTFFLERTPSHQTPHAWLGVLIRLLLFEWIILLVFAVVWQSTGNLATNVGVQITLLGIASFAMGLQGALFQALNVPGVLVDALTGTVLQLGKRFADALNRKASSNALSTWFLIALCLSYTVAAIISAFIISQPGPAFVPVVIVSIVIVVVLVSRNRGAQGERQSATALKE